MILFWTIHAKVITITIVIDRHRLVLTSGMALGNFGSQFSALIASDAARSPESTAPSIAPLNAVEVSVPAQ